MLTKQEQKEHDLLEMAEILGMVDSMLESYIRDRTRQSNRKIDQRILNSKESLKTLRQMYKKFLQSELTT